MHTLCGEETTTRRFESVPIQVDVFHFDRLVVASASGDVTLPEYGKFVGDLIQQGLIHYRKIIDVTLTDSSVITPQVLLAVDARLREYSKTRRGPLAIVGKRDGGEGAHEFKVMTSAERPVEVFRSIHDARAWVMRHPVGEAVAKKPADGK
jgi:hypothetical protein